MYIHYMQKEVFKYRIYVSHAASGVEAHGVNIDVRIEASLRVTCVHTHVHVCVMCRLQLYVCTSWAMYHMFYNRKNCIFC